MYTPVLPRSLVPIFAILTIAGNPVAHAGFAPAAGATPYPQIADTSHATSDVAAFFAAYFAAKSRHDVDATMRHFSPQLATYTDVTLGWPFDSFDALRDLFSRYMPKWPKTGLSYPTRILGGDGSAIVVFTDTPELFGGELHVFGAVDFKDGRIVRWIDYWDASSFDASLYKGMRAPADKFPSDFKERAVGENASTRIRSVATRLQQALSEGDVETAAGLFAYDAIFEDMTLRAQIMGRAAVSRYLARTIERSPYGAGSSLRHVVGNDLGGGFEWIGATRTGVTGGITALELDAEAQITRMTTVYDGREFAPEERRALVVLALEE